MIRRALAALVLAATVALSGACGTTTPEPLFPVNDDVPALTDCLVAHGWHGDPNDAREAVYAPQSAITACLAGGSILDPATGWTR